MVWPFSKSEGKLEARIISLEAQVGAMRVEYADAVQKVLTVVQRVEGKYQMQDFRNKAEAEKAELKEILGGVDIAALMQNPQALQEALKNPALINFALKKFGKELI